MSGAARDIHAAFRDSAVRFGCALRAVADELGIDSSEPTEERESPPDALATARGRVEAARATLYDRVRRIEERAPPLPDDDADREGP